MRNITFHRRRISRDIAVGSECPLVSAEARIGRTSAGEHTQGMSENKETIQ